MSLTLTTTLVAAATLFGAGEDASPLLDKVERAGGDLTKRDPFPSLVLEGTVFAEGIADAAPVEEVYVGAEHARQTVTYPVYGDCVLGRQGGACYSREAAADVTVREGDAAAGVRRMLAIFRRAPWRSIYAGAEHAGVEEVDGRSLTKLRMLPSETTADSSGETGDTWWIDEGRARLVHVDLKLPDPQGGELPCRFTFGDWRVVDGVAFPGTREQRVGSYIVTTTFTKITPGGVVDPSRTTPPDDVVAAIADPSRRAVVARDAGDFAVEEVLERRAFTIRLDVPAAEVSRNLAIVFPELLGVVAKSGAQMSGPPFSRYHNLATAGDTLDLEAGIPVRAAVKVDGAERVTASTLPAGRVATGWHVGPYQELPKTYEKLQRWMAERKLESAGGPWEVYWTDPGLEPDPAKWRTQVFWPVK